MEEDAVKRMKEEFISNISHELRTPLAIAKGSIELVLEEDLSEEQKELLTRGKENLEKLNRIIGDLIEAAQLAGNPELKIENVEINDLLSNCVEELSKKAALKEIKIKIRIPEKLPQVAGDKDKLKKAFTCILENAVKFNRRKGEVFVEAGTFNGSLVITFSDEGIGVPKNHKDKIFEAFYQVDGSTRRRYNGMGLGLAIANKIISLHKGRIFVENRKKGGSVFSVVLPIKRIFSDIEK